MIQVGESPGKGRGVFALRKISSGEIIEEAPVVIVPHAQMVHLDATTLGDYYFLWEPKGDAERDAALLLGLGSICNHSYEPNARFERRPLQLTIAFIALREIAPGEEVTINYNGDPTDREPVWFPLRK